MKLENDSRYKILNILYLYFSIRCGCHSVSAAATYSYEEDRENATELAMGKADGGGYIPLRLSVCP